MEASFESLNDTDKLGRIRRMVRDSRPLSGEEGRWLLDEFDRLKSIRGTADSLLRQRAQTAETERKLSRMLGLES